MTPNDLAWPSFKSGKEILQNKPKIADKWYEKLTITIFGFDCNYYVIQLRYVKTGVTSIFLGSELPLDPVSFSSSS